MFTKKQQLRVILYPILPEEEKQPSSLISVTVVEKIKIDGVQTLIRPGRTASKIAPEAKALVTDSILADSKIRKP